MKVLGERVLAVEYKNETDDVEKTDGGIIIPPSAQEEDKQPNIFGVVAIGDDVTKVSEGDFIFVGDRTSSSVDQMSVDGQKAKIFNESQIIAVDE